MGWLHYIGEIKLNNKRLLALFAMVMTAMVWGITFEIVQSALRDAPPLIFAALRFGIGCVLGFLYYILILKKKVGGITPLELKGGFICGVVLCCGYTSQNFGLWENNFYTAATPSNSAFVTSVSVLLVPVFLYLSNLQKVNYQIWGVVFLATIGLFILLDPTKGVRGGDMVTFGCAVSFAIHIILQDIYLKKGADVLKFFIVQVFFVSIFSFLSSCIIGESQIVFSSDVINALIVTGVLATFVAFILMLWAQTILSATETGILLSLESLFAALYSVFFAHKILGLNGWIGGFIIIIAIMSSSLISHKSSENN